MNKEKISGRRLLIYLIGIIILACGIDLNTKTGLGVSPVISVAYNLAQITGVAIGTMTFLYYCALIVLQFLLLKGKMPLWQLLQVACSFFTSLFIDLFDRILPEPTSILGRGAALLIAIALTGIGAAISVSMRVVPNPADGLADVLGQKLGRDMGFGKNVLDLTCIVIALIIGYAFRRSPLGIGVGTAVAMILTGRVIAWFRPVTARIRRLAGMRQDE
ncbi:MAG: hypothetical protein J6M46_07740 [Lachnospiraceae bacterium]|nr:hypothetical protein [Lachnospiraceae bacterium]